MKTFSIAGARHYCGSFQPIPGIAEKSPDEFRDSKLSNLNAVTEGSSLFSEYQACALRDVERCLLLSASHYRRALDVMIPSSSCWALVTLYYGSLFAAQALLGLFGCGVLHEYVIHVDQSTPGMQRLVIQRTGTSPNRYYVTNRGSHKRFWEIFYKTVPMIKGFADPSFSAVLAPISSSETWLIEQRNKFNYDTYEEIQFVRSFQTSFSSVSFPASLPGILHTQYTVCEGILAIACSFATTFGLSTDALDSLSGRAPIAERVRDLVYSPVVPDLVDMTKKSELFGV